MGDMSDAQFKAIRHWAAVKSWKTRRRNAAKAAREPFQRSLGVDLKVPGTGTLRGDPRGGGAATGQSRGDWRSGDQQRNHADEVALLDGEVHEIKELGGGVSESYKVELDNGKEGCFKPSEEATGYRPGIDGDGAMREKAAWEVGKIVGLDDMMGAVVIREMDVPGMGFFPPGKKMGSLAEWQEGERAKDVHPSIRYGDLHDHQRAAMFDYIIGNQDRHAGNWLVDTPFHEAFEEPEPKIKLIDHNLSFGTAPVEHYGGNREIMGSLARNPAPYAKPPRSGGGKPLEFAKPYVDKKRTILARLLDVGLPADAIDQVSRRIDFASHAESWDDVWHEG